jgi:hypothetical protein
MKLYSIADLCKILKVTSQTLGVYLNRAEFNHLKNIRIGKYKYFENVTNDDIENLKKLTNRKVNKKWKKKVKVQESNIS